MAIRVDKLTATGERGLFALGKRRMELAGLTLDMKMIIRHGSITLIPAAAKTCTSCGELVALKPDELTLDLCPTCLARNLANHVIQD